MPFTPTTARMPGCPAFSGTGSRIVATAPARHSRRSGPLLVTGAFRLTDADAEPIRTEPHRCLTVLSHWEGRGAVVAWTPFMDHALLPDDVVRANGTVTGWFQFDLLARPLAHDGIWFVTIALATALAPVLHVHVEA